MHFVVDYWLHYITSSHVLTTCSGRRFEESTLPARPQIVYEPPQIKTRPSLSDPLKSSNKVTSSKFTNPEDADTTNIVRSSHDSIIQVQNGISHKNTNPGQAGEHESAEDKPSNTNHDAAIYSTTDSMSSQKQTPLPSNARENGAKVTTNSTNKTDNNRQIPSPTSAIPTNAADTQSSPASSNGPSSNTPGPAVASPTTSLGADESLLNSASMDTIKSADQDSARQPPQTPESEIIPSHKMSISSLDVDVMDTDPSAAFDSPTNLSTTQSQPQKDTIARPKPPIRVDTQHALGSSSKPQAMTSAPVVETPAQITGTDTPRQSLIATQIPNLDSSRRATRISSGALQKKSVSEILGETPKSASSHAESPGLSSTRDALYLLNSQNRQIDRERKEKERSKLSTVVFAKPQRPINDPDTIEISGLTNMDLGRASSEERDYLYTLFESKAYSSKQGALAHLIQHAHKTITTADHLVDYEYQAQCRVLKRLYQLQSAERWPLRQRKRVEEPVRQTSHWDFLLDHARWMRTDFREERKWKLAAARSLAEYCAEWVAASPEERKHLQVHTTHSRRHIKNDDNSDVTMDEVAIETSSHPTPELLPSGEDDSVSDDIADPRDLVLSTAPAAIFSLGASDFMFVADRTPAFDKLINELPLYEPAKIEPDLAKSNLAERLDSRWKTDIVAVSRYATEKLKVKEYKPPYKRSRYDYDIETSPLRKTEPLPPRNNTVGLFMPENKHIRDRIHPGHSFRPPSEYNMPTQAFFETRTSSQWTPAEDDELRKLVKDYSYNWSLISSCLTARSLYTSSPDRRTPWECFERWIGLEGMPTDMAKTPYFRTYSGRIDAASRHLQAQLEEAQRRAGPNVTIPTRKRTTQPIRVEKKRAQRHLAMLDAMRKLAKKRETMRQKQSHSAEVAALRKASEVNQHNKPPLRTPAEFSALKFEREQKMAKQQEIYRQQLIAHQRAASAQQQRGTNGQVNGVPNGVPQAGAGRGTPNGAPAPGPNGHLQMPNGVPRHPGMLGPSGMPMPAGMAGPKGMQAQIQANMRNGIANSPQQIRMHQEQLMRQAQQNGGHSSPNVPQANMTNGQNAGFVSDVNGVNGQPSPSAGVSGNAGSPRQPGGMGQALSSGHVPVLTQIAANIKQRHPNMTDEEVQRAASQQLTQWQQQATAAAAGQNQRPRVNQAALNAAMGAANAAAHAGNVAAAAAAAAAVPAAAYPQAQSMMTTEQMQQYNQRMRMQQAQQQAARGMQGQVPMVGQMTNSPVMNMSRPVSQHNNQAGLSRSGTPSQRSGSTPNVNTVNAAASSTTLTTNGIQSASTPHPGGANAGAGTGVNNQSSPPRPVSQQAMQT